MDLESKARGSESRFATDVQAITAAPGQADRVSPFSRTVGLDLVHAHHSKRGIVRMARALRDRRLNQPEALAIALEWLDAQFLVVDHQHMVIKPGAIDSLETGVAQIGLARSAPRISAPIAGLTGLASIIVRLAPRDYSGWGRSRLVDVW